LEQEEQEVEYQIVEEEVHKDQILFLQILHHLLHQQVEAGVEDYLIQEMVVQVVQEEVELLILEQVQQEIHHQ
jgi:hypothetical protein